MPTMFVSYRRDDASGYAGRLYDRLAREFGRENVFIDVGALRPGDDFVDAINDRLQTCDLMIAVRVRWLNIGIVLCGTGTAYADNLRVRVWKSNGVWEDV